MPPESGMDFLRSIPTHSSPFHCCTYSHLTKEEEDHLSPWSLELMKEIGKLEVEILQLECHLLSLYQQQTHPFGLFPSSTAQRNSSATTTKRVDSGHRSLAAHLHHSEMDPDQLSQQILTSISSIYFKFHHHNNPLSLSSSTAFSPRDVWSPQLHQQPKASPHFDNTAAVQVSDLYLDDDTSKYAATLLQSFRSLVKCLEKVDPRKMKREQKLVFWLNIHNSLVMHAYLAYGTHNSVRSTSVLKAAYNVGGYCINACAIQSSILGIRPHYSAPWLQSFVSPRKRSMTGEHPFAIEYPEPLVHFALSSGSYYDPMVRLYRAKNVFQDLKVAREEYIRANVYVHKEKKICMPKIVSYFARDMSMSVSQVLETVCDFLPEIQQKAITASMKNRPDKHICWVPQSSSFRYLIHKEIAGGIIHL